MKGLCYFLILACLVWIIGASSGHITIRGKRYHWRGPFLSKRK